MSFMTCLKSEFNTRTKYSSVNNFQTLATRCMEVSLSSKFISKGNMAIISESELDVFKILTTKNCCGPYIRTDIYFFAIYMILPL